MKNRNRTARFFTWLSVAMIAIAVFVTPVLAMSANAPVPQSEPADIAPEHLAEILLGAVGVALSLAFRYVPKLKVFFDGVKNKGVLMLALVVVFGGIYLALACTPYAAVLGIAVGCGETSVFVLLKAIFYIASGNQLAYLYAPKAKN